MPLDPQAQALLNQAAAAGFPPIFTLPYPDARQFLLNAFVVKGLPEPVHKIEDRIIPGAESDIRVRIYTPSAKGPHPVLVFLHGGGWVLNNLDTHDVLCRRLTNAAECMVVSVDYRLAPEYKFPAGLEDSYAATKWVYENIAEFDGDPSRIAIAGDSSGATYATTVAFMARERGGPPLIYQVLVTPATAHYRYGTPSYEEFATGYSMSKAWLIWCWDYYLANEADATNPYAAPLLAPDLSGLPPALILTAEFDPLRDEGEMYAARLREAGVPVTLTRYDGMMHGFIMRANVLDKGKQAIEEVVAAIRSAFKQ